MKAISVGAAVALHTGLERPSPVRAPGAVIGRVGAPRYEEAPIGIGSLIRHSIRLAGGPSPARTRVGELPPDVLSGTIEPGKVFDATTGLDGVPAGHRDMADHRHLKAFIRP